MILSFYNNSSCIFSMTIIYTRKSALTNQHHSFRFSLLFLNTWPVAVYDRCGSLAFVYWLRLKQFVVPRKAQSHLWLWQFGIYGYDSLGAIWSMGKLSSCICSTLVSVCAMKGIPIEPLAQWRKELAYYLTPLLCLVNWDMYYPGGACRGKDLPPGRILYIH